MKILVQCTVVDSIHLHFPLAQFSPVTLSLLAFPTILSSTGKLRLPGELPREYPWGQDRAKSIQSVQHCLTSVLQHTQLAQERQ